MKSDSTLEQKYALNRKHANQISHQKYAKGWDCHPLPRSNLHYVSDSDTTPWQSFVVYWDLNHFWSARMFNSLVVSVHCFDQGQGFTVSAVKYINGRRCIKGHGMLLLGCGTRIDVWDGRIIADVKRVKRRGLYNAVWVDGGPEDMEEVGQCRSSGQGKMGRQTGCPWFWKIQFDISWDNFDGVDEEVKNWATEGKQPIYHPRTLLCTGGGEIYWESLDPCDPLLII